MDKKKISRQCIKWCKEETSDSEQSRAPNKFTKIHLEEITSPKFEIHDIVRQTVHDSEEYPIFFIRERQIMGGEKIGDYLEWRYFGSLFSIENGKIEYKTTSFIPEKHIKSFD